jgi:hypothetical protein
MKSETVYLIPLSIFIQHNHLWYCRVPANSTFCTCKYREVPANSAFEAPKAELAAELTDTLENIRYLFEINAAIMA